MYRRGSALLDKTLPPFTEARVCLLFALALLLALWVPAPAVFAGTEYQGNLERGLTRGLKNIVGAPLEIPATIARHHAGSGRPVIRETAGLFDGLFRTVARAGNGFFDTAFVFVPGEQEGYPMDPETLF